MRCVDVLGLKVKITGDGVEDEDCPGPVDLDVAMLGDASWPAGLIDATERLCYADPDIDEHGIPIIQVWEHGDGFYRLRYWDASEFLIDRTGSRVWARWPATVPHGEIVMCLFGPIIGFVLHLRGTPCLHASAVAVDGGAIAFLGHSGAGKSTTAAAFVRRGYPALTDDVLALDERQDPGVGSRDSGTASVTRADEGKAGALPHASRTAFFVRPGHNLVRLWPDAVRALYGSENALPAGADAKRQLDLHATENAFQADALPLAAIYVLADRVPGLDAPTSIIDLTGHQALMALVARTYMNYVLDVDLRVRALTVFARLAAQVSIRQLTVRHDAGALGELTDAILGDLASLDRRF